ncbi:XK-related protein 6 [Anabrus simplex]|uniref:XK-related protein 6 n=1 Tax=Anabrus simplex TaxID=316456 RepID=UPI0034DCEC69
MPSFINDNNSDDIPYDKPDYAPNRAHVTDFDIFALLVSIISHIVDVAFDINLAYRYYRSGKTTYFQLTLLFILFPAFVNTVISTKMYVKDEDSISVAKVASKRWIIRIFILIFQLAPILRYCESLGYALKSRRAEKERDYLNQRKFYDLMLKEDSDVALLRVFECFLEAAPQQVLQATILLVGDTQAWTFQYFSQVGSVCSSLFSMGWSMASYHRTIRFAQEDKDNISIPGTVVQFLWHFMVTVSRILSISVAASLFPLPTTAASGIHWLVMTVWLIVTTDLVICTDSHDPMCSGRLGQFLMCSILGLVYIFTYITPEDGRTRNKYIVYYLLCVAENISAAVVWATAASPTLRAKWYFYPLLVSCIVPFGLGIGFMVLYYLYFHPSSKRGNLATLPPKNSAVQTTNGIV